MTEAIKIQRVDARQGSSVVLSELRDKLSPRGDIVSPRGKALTEEVFGRALSPIEVVQTICSDVQKEGTPALLRYTESLDKVKLTSQQLRVTESELAEAHAKADPQLLESVRRIRDNITRFQQEILHQDVKVVPGPGIELLHCLLYTSPSPRDVEESRMPSSA